MLQAIRRWYESLGREHITPQNEFRLAWNVTVVLVSRTAVVFLALGLDLFAQIFMQAIADALHFSETAKTVLHEASTVVVLGITIMMAAHTLWSVFLLLFIQRGSQGEKRGNANRRRS